MNFISTKNLGIGAALALGCWIATQFWSQWPHPRTVHPSPSRLAPQAAKPSARSPVPDKLASLLGTDASSRNRPLKLVLVATRPGPTLGESTASLGTDPRNPQTYAGGAILSNGARIAEVRPDHIVLSQGGNKSTLRIEPGVGGEPAP